MSRLVLQETCVPDHHVEEIVDELLFNTKAAFESKSQFVKDVFKQIRQEQQQQLSEIEKTIFNPLLFQR